MKYNYALMNMEIIIIIMLGSKNGFVFLTTFLATNNFRYNIHDPEPNWEGFLLGIPWYRI